MLYLAIIVILFYHSIDLIILDGISLPIPLLKLFSYKVLFYCHFPDLLLCTNRKGISKQYYRYFIDYLEEWSTSYSSHILVNSYFTLEIFQETFPNISKKYIPQVLYPVVREIAIEDLPLNPMEYTPYCKGYDYIFLSLNRYERKKNIQLAISSLKQLYKNIELHNLSSSSSLVLLEDIHHISTKMLSNHKILLVIAGGYDIYLNENVEYLKELFDYCKELGLTYQYITEDSIKTNHIQYDVNIIFRTSISTVERTSLLLQTIGLLYTPEREHFGIVPIEAMSLSVPVIACNSGGPKETIAHNITGYLCQSNIEEFSMAMLQLLLQQQPLITTNNNTSNEIKSKDNLKSNNNNNNVTTANSIDMRKNAKLWVQEKFSYESMKNNLKDILDKI